MATKMTFPDFCSVEDWREIVKNNFEITHIHFHLHTTEKFVSHALAQAGFFESASQVKKNRPDLWRAIVDGETVKMGKWASIKLTQVTCIIEVDDVTE